MYYTTLLCPVCRKLTDTIKHPEPELQGIVFALLIGDCRRVHKKESPSCSNHFNWANGFIEETSKCLSRDKLINLSLWSSTFPENHTFTEHEILEFLRRDSDEQAPKV